MTSYFSYIGDFDDPTFHWDNPVDSPTTSNLPRRVLSDPPFMGVSTLYMLQLISEGRRDCKQLDWGAWGLKMTGAELREFFISLSRRQEEIDSLSVLDPGKTYVLVAGESS